jgi:hypothetical protein
MYVGIPAVDTKVAAVYLSDFWLLSRMASIFTPCLWALTRAFAIVAEVKE